MDASLGAASSGSGYIDDAVAALQGTTVFVSPEVGDASGLQGALQAQVGNSSIGVAVFSDNVALEASGPEIVSQLAEATDYDTIIVAVGDDLLAGSHVLETGEAMRIANEAESSADGLDAALIESVQEVQAATAASAGDAGGAGDGAGVDAGPIVGVVIAAAVVVAGAGVAIGMLRARRRSGMGADRRVPDQIRRHVANLRSLSGAYAQVGATGNAVAAETATEISGIAVNVEELFTRLDQRSSAGQRGTAAVEYDATLRKLTAALDRDYLLDILTHPNLWDDPDERVREVQDAVTAVSAELVQNIKQVNARRGLQFQVSLDGMIGRRKELQEWERAFDRAARDEDGAPGADG